MKYRIIASISFIAVCFGLIGSVHYLSASNDRGERQFTFTTDSRGANPSLPSDGATAKFKEEHRRKEADLERATSQSVKEIVPAPPGQQAGQSADETLGGEARTTIGREAEDPILKQQGIDELRNQNQTTGQTSNVPGTTGTSPNGTSNLFGTKGIPIFPGDRNK